MTETTGTTSETAPVPGLERSDSSSGPIVLTLFGILFLASVDNQLLIPLLPVLGRDLGEPLSRLGWLFSGYALAAGASNLLLGPLSDRYGRVIFMRVGLGIFALLSLATYASPSFDWLFWLRGATGAVAGILATCTISYVGDAFPYKRRGRVMGTVLSAYFAALILGIPLSAWIADRWEWRSVFVAIAGLALLLFAVSLAALRSDRTARRTVTPRAYRLLLARADTRAALGVSFLVSGGTLAFYTYIAGYLNSAFQLEGVEISLVFVIAGTAALVASPLSGWLADRWTKGRLFLLFNSLLVLPLMGLVWTPWGAPMAAVLFAISLCIAFRQTALQTLQTALVTTGQRGSFLALRGFSSQLGISFSVFAAGLLYDGWGYGAVTALAAGLTLAATALFAAAVPEPSEETLRQRE